jgi:putative serine protease PepD
MTTGFDSYTPVAVPEQRTPSEPPVHDATTAPSRIGHPRPARHASPYLFSEATESAYPVVADAVAAPGPVVVGTRPSLSSRFAPGGVLMLVVVLVGVVGWQAYQLERLDERIAAAEQQLAQSVVAERASVASLESRATELEAEAARAFNPEAISAAVLPSVFRVRAGNFTGTAFAVGDKAADDEANLLTNYHVVESVWDADGRKVFLERGGVEVTATIVKVDKDNDLALLRVGRKLPGLATTTKTVKAGQPVMSAGAPLGLEDTVTTGVISAFRKDKNAGPTMIQFDAPINPGNSGGPLINSARQVVGLTTAKARDAEGIGLAIPIKTACDAFENVC